VFLPVSTGTKSIIIDQETAELLSKTKWHSFYGSRCRFVTRPAGGTEMANTESSQNQRLKQSRGKQEAK